MFVSRHLSSPLTTDYAYLMDTKLGECNRFVLSPTEEKLLKEAELIHVSHPVNNYYTKFLTAIIIPLL